MLLAARAGDKESRAYAHCVKVILLDSCCVDDNNEPLPPNAKSNGDFPPPIEDMNGWINTSNRI